jgi:hypothetical protein
VKVEKERGRNRDELIFVTLLATKKYCTIRFSVPAIAFFF